MAKEARNKEGSKFLKGMVDFYHKPVENTPQKRGEKMKKLMLLLLAFLGLAVNVLADNTATPTYTVTPNLTATQAMTNLRATQTAIAATATYIRTAFPTLTPTLTPTGTISPSPTYTPAPKQLKNSARLRLYFRPQNFTQGDGLTVLGATALPGAASAWLAQVLSQTVAVLSTGAAEVRLGMTVPWDFKGDLRLYCLMGAATAGDSVTITARIAGQGFNKTTVTAGTFSYQAPGGGRYNLNGTATNLLTQAADPLWASTLVVSRVLMPLNVAAYSYSTSNPPGNIQAGDVLNFDLLRTSGGTDNVYIYSIEVQYDNATGANP